MFYSLDFNNIEEIYENERRNAIDTLYKATRHLRREIDDRLKYSATEDLSKLVEAYAPAQLALMQLMKEEINESKE